MNNKSLPFVSYAALPLGSNVFTTLIPKSGLSTAIIFKSSVVGPAVPAGNPGDCWTTARELDCCWVGLPRDCAAVGRVCAQRATKVSANKARLTITKRRYVFISVLRAN